MGENKMVPYFTLDLEASFSIPNILENKKQLEEMNENEAKESKSKSKSKEAKDPSIVAFMSCHRIKTQKRKLKMLMNTSKLRQDYHFTKNNWSLLTMTFGNTMKELGNNNTVEEIIGDDDELTLITFLLVCNLLKITLESSNNWITVLSILPNFKMLK